MKMKISNIKTWNADKAVFKQIITTLNIYIRKKDLNSIIKLPH